MYIHCLVCRRPYLVYIPTSTQVVPRIYWSRVSSLSSYVFQITVCCYRLGATMVNGLLCVSVLHAVMLMLVDHATVYFWIANYRNSLGRGTRRIQCLIKIIRSEIFCIAHFFNFCCNLSLHNRPEQLRNIISMRIKDNRRTGEIYY